MKKEKRKKWIIGILLIMNSMFFVNVSAVGVGYSQNIEVYPGQDYTTSFSLQNTPAGNGDLVFNGLIDEGGQFVSFEDADTFTVPDGNVVYARYTVRVPASANVGDEYTVRGKFRTSPVSLEYSGVEKNGVQFNLGVGYRFKIRIIEKPVKLKPEIAVSGIGSAPESDGFLGLNLGEIENTSGGVGPYLIGGIFVMLLLLLFVGIILITWKIYDWRKERKGKGK